MKRILLLMSLQTLFFTAKSQIYIDNINQDMADVVADDTIIQFTTEQLASGWSIDLEFTTLNADNSTVDIVVANRRGEWKALVITGFPFTLDATTLTDTTTLKAAKSIYGNKLTYPFVGIRLKKGSVTSGTFNARRIMEADIKRNAAFP